jgi:hypothetical protein
MATANTLILLTATSIPTKIKRKCIHGNNGYVNTPHNVTLSIFLYTITVTARINCVPPVQVSSELSTDHRNINSDNAAATV